MSDIIEDIKARLGIQDVISAYVQLKKAGVNYKGLCPFHSEKTPSFVVSPEKQIFHCFGCNKGGDIFTFTQEIEGLDFPEALQVLADRAGIKIDKISSRHFMSGQNKDSKEEKEEYFKAHDLAADIFEKQLHKTNDGKKVMEYLHKRGVSEATIKEFRLGFSPDEYDFLYPKLLDKGISKKILIECGIVSAKNLADDRIYDKFRGRLMFPIFDYMGRICGFGGRALKKDQEPKYLNSPENKIYSKSKILYGLSHAKEAIKKAGEIILVEGYFDVIMPHQEGVKNVVATSGTALTTTQVRIIKRFCGSVVSCFDTDHAGSEATRRAYDLLKAEDIQMKTIFFDDIKDPADFVLKNKGEAFTKLAKEAKDFVSFFIDKLFTENDVGSLSGRRKVLSELLPILKGTAVSLQDLYIKEVAQKMNMDAKILYDEIGNYKLSSNHPARASENSQESIGNKMFVSEMVLALVIKFPFLMKSAYEILKDEDFDETGKSIYKGLADQYNHTRDELDEWDFSASKLAELKGKIDVLSIYAEEKYNGFSDDALANEFVKLIDKMKKDRKTRGLKEIQLQIEQAEKEGKKDKIVELLKFQQTILSEK